MKKLLVLILVISTTISVAQESVLLRLNYSKNDVYSIKMNQSVNSSAMMMGNIVEMEMKVLNEEENIFTTETRISRMAVDMLQGETSMSFDSNQKDEELDDMGKMMKSQMSPMLNVVIISQTNELGKVLETKVEPNFPGADQFKNQTVSYPENKVKIGDVWTDENETQGVKTTTEYKILKITESEVEVAIKGEISGLASGSIEGTINIDKNSGVPLKSTLKSKMDSAGQLVNVNVEITTTKI